MEETPTGTPVGVDDPYEHVDRCDHLTDDGRCRFAVERSGADPAFAEERREEDYRCPVVADAPESVTTGSEAADGGWDWAECRNFRSTTDGKECVRCGLEERRMAHDDERSLIEEHHLSYADAADAGGDGERGVGATRGEGDEFEGQSTSEGDASGGDVPTERDDTPTGGVPAERDDTSAVPGGDPLGDVWGIDALDPGDEGGDGHERRNGETSHEDETARNDETSNDPDTTPDGETAHEITVALCRWCHAKVHTSWARIDDDVSPDPEAIAAREQRRSREEHSGFESAADRYDLDP